MKKVSIKDIFIFLLFMLGICYLKKNYINEFDTSLSIYETFVFWGDNQIVNLIWYLPILLNLYIIGKKYFYQILRFDMRFKNRSDYIRYQLKQCIVFSLIFNFLILFFQFIILIGKLGTINITFLLFCMKYIIEMIFMNVVFILISMNLNNFTYTFILVVFLQIFSLTMIDVNDKYPFLNLYGGYKINFLTLILLFLCLKGIVLKYKFFELK